MVIKDRRAVAGQRADLIAKKDFASLLLLDRAQLDNSPADSERHRLLSWTLAMLGHVEEAIEHQLVAVQAAPDNPRLRRRLASLYRRVPDAASAEVQLKEAKRATAAERQQFVDDQRNHKDRSKEVILSSLSDLGGWHYGSAIDKLQFPSIFDAHAIDTTANWTRYMPVIASGGDVVDLDEIGRFRVGRAEQTIHVRLERGIPWELPIAAFVSELASITEPSALLVEVGANIGTILVPMARRFSGQVLAFEPLGENFADLMDSIALNELTNVIALNCAVGSTPGYGEMVNGNPRNPGMARLSVAGHGRVAITTVDIEVANLGRPVAFIKLDVEGHESEVLEGAKNTLTTDRPLVVIEMLPDKSDDLKNTMRQLGYTGRRLFRSDWLFQPT